MDMNADAQTSIDTAGMQVRSYVGADLAVARPGFRCSFVFFAGLAR
jgi:hypothetical protein